MVLAFR